MPSAFARIGSRAAPPRRRPRVERRVRRRSDARVRGRVHREGARRLPRARPGPPRWQRSTCRPCARDATSSKPSATVGGWRAATASANLYDLGMGVKVDHDKALSFFQRACVGGFGPGCVNVGNAFVEGNVVLKDDRQARHFYGLTSDRPSSDGGQRASWPVLGRYVACAPPPLRPRPRFENLSPWTRGQGPSSTSAVHVIVEPALRFTSARRSAGSASDSRHRLTCSNRRSA